MRTRISTTVDATKWERVRQLTNSPASKIVDRALEALVDQLEADQELRALEKAPYEQDSNLNWEADPGPDLPYEGKVPEDILRLATERRRRAKR